MDRDTSQDSIIKVSDGAKLFFEMLDGLPDMAASYVNTLSSFLMEHDAYLEYKRNPEKLNQLIDELKSFGANEFQIGLVLHYFSLDDSHFFSEIQATSEEALQYISSLSNILENEEVLASYQNDIEKVATVIDKLKSLDLKPTIIWQVLDFLDLPWKTNYGRS